MLAASHPTTSRPYLGTTIPTLLTNPQIIEDINAFSPSTKVLGSLTDEFQALTDDTWVDDDEDDSHLTTPIKWETRAATKILKPNPKYALAVVASKVKVPRSPKYALTTGVATGDGKRIQSLTRK